MLAKLKKKKEYLIQGSGAHVVLRPLVTHERGQSALRVGGKGGPGLSLLESVKWFLPISLAVALASSVPRSLHNPSQECIRTVPASCLAHVRKGNSRRAKWNTERRMK